MNDSIKQKESERIEFQRRFSEQQQKFIYYIIALCVTAIGFSVHITNGIKLSYSQIPLGIAVLLWGISIYEGFSSLKAIINYLKNMNEAFEKMLNPYDGFLLGVTNVSDTYEYRKAQEGKVKLEIHFRAQEITFLLGVVAFIVWHILEMYLRSV